VTFDLGEDPGRLRSVLDHAQPAQVTHVRGEITDLDARDLANTKGDN
jgi:hypothetical protein